MEMSNTISELAKALCKAQTSMKPVIADSENPFFKSKYADLAAVWENCRKPLTDNGLSVVQILENENGHVIVKTVLLHESGEWISSRLALTPVKTDPQSTGSAITYGRRYSLAALVGVCAEDEDDDAEKATRNIPDNQQKKALPRPQPSGEQAKTTVINKIKEFSYKNSYDLDSFRICVEEILCAGYKVPTPKELTGNQWSAILKNIEKLLKKAEERYMLENPMENVEVTAKEVADNIEKFMSDKEVEF